MLRALVVLVLLANAAFFAWTQGWLSPWVSSPLLGERDPARLAAQVRPETVTVLSPKAASAALQAARAASAAAGEGEQCMQLGPFGDSDATSTENQLIAAGVPREAITRAELPGEGNRFVLRIEKTTPTLRLQLRASYPGIERCAER